MDNNCCQYCKERTITCRSECQKYKEFLKINEKHKKMRKSAEIKYRTQFYDK